MHGSCIKEDDIVFVIGEIATGFVPSGKLFTCEHTGICSDIIFPGFFWEKY
ncbi:MAG: hypothetical protein OXC48_09520 [Endozoicomonadaceae bacterium]|nr:hypothetical protein [Endozoicomonadaceae bacterium]